MENRSCKLRLAGEASVESFQSSSFDIEKVATSCFSNLIWNILSHKALKKNSFISNKFKKVIEKAPDNVVKNLKSLGINRDMVEWIGSHTGIRLTEYIDKYY